MISAVLTDGQEDCSLSQSGLSAESPAPHTYEPVAGLRITGPPAPSPQRRTSNPEAQPAGSG